MKRRPEPQHLEMTRDQQAFLSQLLVVYLNGDIPKDVGVEITNDNINAATQLICQLNLVFSSSDSLFRRTLHWCGWNPVAGRGVVTEGSPEQEY